MPKKVLSIFWIVFTRKYTLRKVKSWKYINMDFFESVSILEESFFNTFASFIILKPIKFNLVLDINQWILLSPTCLQLHLHLHWMFTKSNHLPFVSPISPFWLYTRVDRLWPGCRFCWYLFLVNFLSYIKYFSY